MLSWLCLSSIIDGCRKDFSGLLLMFAENTSFLIKLTSTKCRESNRSQAIVLRQFECLQDARLPHVCILSRCINVYHILAGHLPRPGDGNIATNKAYKKVAIIFSI